MTDDLRRIIRPQYSPECPAGMWMSFESPFASWNLRRNPFGELSREERGELAVVERIEDWLKVLEGSMSALQFVGDCGFGKTTHLLALLRHLPAASYVYYPEAGTPPPLPRARPVLIDEAQRMGRRQEIQLIRHAGPVVLGTHVDFTSRLQRAGFEVTTVNVESPKTSETLTRILNRRIEASRLSDDQSLPLIAPALAAKLLQRFGSNVRNIEHFLYDCFQRSVAEHAPWPPAI